jgi:translation initiation factor 3 subunit L
MISSNVAQIHNLYSSAFPRLTNEHYAQVEWPEVEVAQCLVDNNEVFGLFYRELYFRHIYSKLQPNIDDRFSSYENYCAIFNYILNSDGPVPIELPAQWLWDIVDEFVWQFASFAQWRSRPKGKTEDEVALLAENPQVWSCYSVLNVLYSLIQKSKIQDQLRAQAKGETGADVAGEYGSKPLYKMLGLYSMVTLVRVHALLGDYTLALKMLDDADMKRLVSRFLSPATRRANVDSAADPRCASCACVSALLRRVLLPYGPAILGCPLSP